MSAVVQPLPWSGQGSEAAAHLADAADAAGVGPGGATAWARPTHALTTDVAGNGGSATRAAVDLLLAGAPDAAMRALADTARQARAQQLPALAAQARHHLALLVLMRGQHRAGLQILAHVQRDYLGIGQPELASDVARDMADACLRLRLWPEASVHLRGLIHAQQGQSDMAPLPWLWLQQALVQVGAGQRAAALATLGWAEVLFERHPDGLGQARCRLLRLALRLGGQPTPAQAQAAEVAGEALALQAQLGAAPLLQAQCLQAQWLQARAHRLAGGSSAALALLPALCAPQVQAVAPWLHAQAWTEAGLAHLAQGDHKTAAAALEQAMARLDDLWAALPQGPSPTTDWLWEDDGLLQASAARLALALRHEAPAQALRWLHHHRVRQLRNRQAGADLLDLADAGQRPRLAAWRAQHAWLQRRRQRTLEDDPQAASDATETALWHTERSLLDSARRLRRLGTTGPTTAQDGDTALDIPGLCRHFRQARALVHFGEVQGQLLAMVIARGQVHQVLLPARVEEAGTAVEELQAALERQAGPEAGGTAAAAAAEPWAMSAALRQADALRRLQALHRMLWAPLDDALRDATDVVVVPCTALLGLPFAALHDGIGWLDQRCTLRMAATLLLALMPGPPDGRPHDAGMDAPTTTATPQTRAALVDLLRQDHPVQLACPLHLRHDNPAFSGWRLGDGNLAVAADLEAGSACAPLVLLTAPSEDPFATGPGGPPGDALLAPVLALRRAGVRQVVQSLWAVPQAITTGLVARFGLHAGTPGACAAAALQRARAELRLLHPEPGLWAALCLHGGQPVQAGADSPAA